MNRRELLWAAGTAAVGLVASPLVRGWAAEPKGRKKHVLFFTKSSAYEHDVVKRDGEKPALTERVLAELGKQHGFEVTATKDGGVFDSGLDDYDAFFFFTQGDLMVPGVDKNPPMTAAGKKALLDAIHTGKGFVGTHCASDTFHSAGEGKANQPVEKRDPYIQMVGGEFIVHGEQQEAGLKVADAHFPGCGELGEGFRINDEWYALKNFAPDLHVILVQDTHGMRGGMYHRSPYPQTWARRHGQGRVFFTSMGHRADVWPNPKFQQVLLGGLAWALGNVEAMIPPNLNAVTPHADQLGA